MKRRINSVACALPALTLLLASCTADKIEVPDKELYTREFIKQFGTFSSDAGWNSATRVTANIDPSIVAGGTDIKVFTAWPTNPDCRIVASFPASTTNFEFDYPDGLEYAYVQVLDANGTSVYGGYTRVTDGQLNVGQAGRASRADEPTGGSHYTVYTYDLTGNKALGTFLVDETYNKDFWNNKFPNLYSPKKDAPDAPDNSNPGTTIWEGSQYFSDWSDGHEILHADDSYLKNATAPLYIQFSISSSSESDMVFGYYKEQNRGAWDVTEIKNNCERVKPFQYIINQSELANLQKYGLSVKCNSGVTLTKIAISDSEIADNSSVIVDPDNIDVDSDNPITFNNGNDIDLKWDLDQNTRKLSGFNKIQSNRIVVTIEYSAKEVDSNNKDHMFAIKKPAWKADGTPFEEDVVASGNLKNYTLGERKTIDFYINEEKCNSLKKDDHLIAGVNVTIHKITFKNLPFVKKTEGGTANFSGLFKLYGLTTTSGVSDMEGYKNNALKPYNDYQPDGYSAHDLVSLVGSKTGVFHEEVNNNTGECNLKHFKDKLHPEDGVDYQLKQDGEVSLDYFFGCASTFNSFGYFYYTDTEAHLSEQEFVKTLLSKPKFLLMYRAFPHSNIQIQYEQNGPWSNLTSLNELMNIGSIVESGDDEGKDMSGGGFNNDGKPKNDWSHCGEFTHLVDAAEAAIDNGTATTDRAEQYPRFRSANYRLVYFRPDQFEDDGVTLKANQQGSYIFPAGTHIAFFVINGGQYALQQGEKSGFKLDHTRISFSRPLLNKYLGNVFDAGGHSHVAISSPSTNKPGAADATDAWTPFVTYKWGGDVIMGVEDYFARTHDGINGGDHDMNDMLFRVKGEFVRDREEMNPNTPKSQNWIIACEDLGGTHDFDFNDVVFGVTHVAGEETATVTALASGGTLPVYLESIYQQTSNSSSGVTREDNITYYTLTPEGTRDGEFHKWWGENNHHSGIINATGWKGAGKSIQIQVGKDFTLSDVTKTKPGTVENGATNMGGFRVRVKRSDKESITISAPTRNPLEPGYEAPQMFLVPHTWYWPQENQFILDVYPDFNNWGEGVNWWNNATGPDKENVIKHNWVPTTPATTTK